MRANTSRTPTRACVSDDEHDSVYKKILADVWSLHTIDTQSYRTLYLRHRYLLLVPGNTPHANNMALHSHGITQPFS